jgi:NTE family protein
LGVLRAFRLPRPFLLSLAVLLAPLGRTAAAQGRCPTPFAAPDTTPFTLVLSGGGARGIAHIGVLRVLDSLGIRPRSVVGTSMGALIGALYASGRSGSQIDSLVRGLHFSTLFHRYTPVTLLTTGDFTSPVSALAPTFVVEFKGGTLSLQSPVAREPEINALLNQILLRGNLTAAGDFDRLPLRFRAVATDLKKRAPVVLAGGDLAEAVRASIAIPVVFTPVEREDRLLLDGGLAANVPVEAARASGAARVLVSDVGVSVADSTDDISTAAMVTYLIDELFRQPEDSLDARDLRIRPSVHDFNPIEFTDELVGPLIDSGYVAAARALADCAPSALPVVMVSSSSRTADADRIADRLARLADERAYESVWLRPRLIGDSLAFAPTAVPAPARVMSVGLSYDAQQGARGWLSATSVSSPGGRMLFRGTLWAGQWRQQFMLAATGVRRRSLLDAVADSADGPIHHMPLPDPRSDRPPWSMLTRNLLHSEFAITGSREIVRLYDGRGHERDRPSTRDLVLFGGIGVTPSAGQRIVLGPVAHLWNVRSGGAPLVDEAHALGGMVRAARWFAVPAVGPDISAVPTLATEALWLDRYRRADALADLRFERGEFVLRPRAMLGWGRDLPLDAQFVLGGTRGFPGLRTGERRGDRVASLSLAVLRNLAGPFYLRAEAGAGYTSLEHSRPFEGLAQIGRGWVQGVELGLASDTPFGSFSIGVGVATTDRPVFKVSLGS